MVKLTSIAPHGMAGAIGTLRCGRRSDFSLPAPVFNRRKFLVIVAARAVNWQTMLLVCPLRLPLGILLETAPTVTLAANQIPGKTDAARRFFHPTVAGVDKRFFVHASSTPPFTKR
ncbi:MAG: hypothetical protein H6644_01370 [Caldilineaceae bacterium]|nr:hypothetical protein [Caldilineaceae bacterium]